MEALTQQLQELCDRTDVVDALYRFAAGQDHDDSARFASAFARGAVLDFTAAAQTLGLTIPVMQGREQIVQTIMAVVSPLDTTHTVTNPRITVRRDRAQLVALVGAQHLPKRDHSRHLLLKNHYVLDLIREGGYLADSNPGHSKRMVHR